MDAVIYSALQYSAAAGFEETRKQVCFDYYPRAPQLFVCGLSCAAFLMWLRIGGAVITRPTEAEILGNRAETDAVGARAVARVAESPSLGR